MHFGGPGPQVLFDLEVDLDAGHHQGFGQPPDLRPEVGQEPVHYAGEDVAERVVPQLRDVQQVEEPHLRAREGGREPAGVSGWGTVWRKMIGFRGAPPPPPPLWLLEGQENYPAEAHPSAHKSVLESVNPRTDSGCACGCPWSTARATARLWDG